MAARVGDCFPAVVSGVTRFGLFLTTSEGAEGFLGVEQLPARHYDFDEAHLTLTGPSGEAHTLGQPMEVRCLSADIASGRVDFAPADRDAPPPALRHTDRHADRTPREKRSAKQVGRRPQVRKTFGGRKGRKK